MYEKTFLDAIYDYIFEKCDKVSLFSSDFAKKSLKKVKHLDETKFKEVILASTKEFADKSWGMTGHTFEFRLTKGMQKFMRNFAPNDYIKIGEFTLENLNFYQGDKVMYSVCTHEGWEGYDEDFKTGLAEICCNLIEKTQFFSEKYAILSKNKKIKAEIDRELTILSNLELYVQADSDAFIYSVPRYAIDFKGYVALAEQYLGTQLINKIKSYESFAQMNPEGYAKTIEECLKDKKVQYFSDYEWVKSLKNEIFYLRYCFAKIYD